MDICFNKQMLKTEQDRKDISVAKEHAHIYRGPEFGSHDPHPVCQLQEYLTTLASTQAPTIM